MAAAGPVWQLDVWNESHRDYPSRVKEPGYIIDRVRDYIAYNKLHHPEPKSLLSFLAKPLKENVVNFLVPEHRTRDRYQLVTDRRVKIALDDESIRLLKREIRTLLRDNAKLKVSEEIWRALIANIHLIADRSDPGLRAHVLSMVEEEGRKKKRHSKKRHSKKRHSKKRHSKKRHSKKNK